MKIYCYELGSFKFRELSKLFLRKNTFLPCSSSSVRDSQYSIASPVHTVFETHLALCVCKRFLNAYNGYLCQLSFHSLLLQCILAFENISRGKAQNKFAFRNEFLKISKTFIHVSFLFDTKNCFLLGNSAS